MPLEGVVYGGGLGSSRRPGELTHVSVYLLRIELARSSVDLANSLISVISLTEGGLLIRRMIYVGSVLSS